LMEAFQHLIPQFVHYLSNRSYLLTPPSTKILEIKEI
jgi:hypothetical protein